MLAANKNMEAGLDLDEYCARIGYEGPRQPTVEVLHALTAAHSQSIPFENLDVVLGRPIQLEVEALYRKLVVARRGGYCFEQNGLFLEVLRALGFEACPLSARVRLGLAHRAQVAARTHLLVEVRIEGEAWLSDVGVGAASLTRALRWQVDVEQPTPHEPRRLQYEEGRWFHQMYRGGEWVDVYEFSGERMPFIDRVVANWYVSTHPESRFTHTPMVARARSGGRRVALASHELTLRNAAGVADVQKLDTAAQWADALHEFFGIELARSAAEAVFHSA